MKHSVKITIILLTMFLLAQFIGLFIISSYAPIYDDSGKRVNGTANDLPPGFNDVPEDMNPYTVLLSIIVPMFLGVVIMLTLMKYKIESLIKILFFIAISVSLYISAYSILKSIFQINTTIFVISLVISLTLTYLKLFRRNIIVHNFTELLIYPGIAAIFVSMIMLNDKSLSNSYIFGGIYKAIGISAGNWSIAIMVLLLILISVYDMYAVWKAKFMQKMAQYQISTLKIFSGFFVPYLGKKERDQIKEAKRSKSSKNKKMKVNIAILGGGDVVFPMILAGVVLNTLGLLPALIISLGATISLAYLFYISEKGKFYPAMPFISIGCFIALVIAYLV